MRGPAAWLLGSVEATVTGETPEAVPGRCVRAGAMLWRVESLPEGGLRVRVPTWQGRLLERAAAACGCTLSDVRRRGLPWTVWGLRRRYALLAGLVLCVAALAVGGRFVLLVDVTGNETIASEEILAQLRLVGVAPGTYAPGIDVRDVENRMMLAMDGLSFFSLNLHGARAEVIVREAAPTPETVDGSVPTDVVACADGLILHLEPWAGDPCCAEGDTVVRGQVLITGTMPLDPPPNVEAELGTMLAHARGRVLARTWRTMEAELPLTAQAKRYTGRDLTRYSCTVMGSRVEFYRNSGIPYERYDIMTKTRSWTPMGGGSLPVVWETQTVREYELVPAALDEAAAEERLRQALLTALEAELDEGSVTRTDFTARVTDGVLHVVLRAECTEQLGRERPIDTPERVIGPRDPDAPRTEGRGPDGASVADDQPGGPTQTQTKEQGA